MNKYLKPINKNGSVFEIDVYDILQAWRVMNPALQHLIKKALQCGARGHKSKLEDLNDIIASAKRALEIEKNGEIDYGLEIGRIYEIQSGGRVVIVAACPASRFSFLGVCLFDSIAIFYDKNGKNKAGNIFWNLVKESDNQTNNAVLLNKLVGMQDKA